MPDFAYTARDMTGTKVTGTLTAGSEREAISMLSTQSLFPVSVQAGKAAHAGITLRGRRPNGQLMATTYAQLAALLRSGVPLLRSLAVVCEQTSHAMLKDVMKDVHSRVEEGTTLGDAIARHPRVFHEMAINMEIGRAHV